MTVTDRTVRTVLRKLNLGVQKQFYPHLTRRVDDDVLFLNWGYEEDPPLALALDTGDEPYRYPIQLYHATATQADITGKQVLEVGCGHGGGASYLTRTLRPASYIGLDLNGAGVEFCRRRHHVHGLSFVQGNAEDLPFPDESCDAVINIESSCCYPHVDRFFSEVTRVLRPGGVFLYADMRQSFDCAEWDEELADSGLHTVSWRDINAEVLRGMDGNSPRWEAVAESMVPRFLRPLVGVPVKDGSLYRDIAQGKQCYRMYHLAKD